MVDFIHFLFEEDSMSISTQEQGEARDKMRSTLYKTLYNREYKYAVSKSQAAGRIPDDIVSEELTADDIPTPVDPVFRSKGQLKPYIPPTNVSSSSILPFGSKLDGPLG